MNDATDRYELHFYISDSDHLQLRWSKMYIFSCIKKKLRNVVVVRAASLYCLWL